jgi:hypothetical protein
MSEIPPRQRAGGRGLGGAWSNSLPYLEIAYCSHIFTNSDIPRAELPLRAGQTADPGGEDASYR